MMNKILNSFEYSHLLEDRNFMKFYIPIKGSDLLKLNDYSDLLNQILEFQYVFNSISSKYSVCEMRSAQNDQISLDFYKQQTLLNFNEKGRLSIFPLELNHFKTKVAYFDGGLLNYKFIENVMTPFESNPSNSIPAIDIIGIGVFVKDAFNSWWDVFEYPLEFLININTDLFFNKFKFAFLKDHQYGRISTIGLDENILDNADVGYFNATRFNSFIRELKDIWKNTFGWGYKFEGNEKFVDESQFDGFPPDLDYCINGIPIDGKISYCDENVFNLLSSISNDDK